MAREYVAVIKDDLTGKTIKDDEAHSVRIGWQGKWYVLDLAPDSAEQVMTVMDKYVKAGTLEQNTAKSTPGPRSTSGRGRADKEQLAAMRAWGEANGFKVNTRGRLSQELQDAYHAAN